ncbi:MAG: hypothetical protein LBV20_05850 [Treponema sp.]|jgi:hypothetical protein|nr:hypothetical protein [Treponema sp.]
MSGKNVFDRFNGQEAFIKTTKPLKLEGSQKAALNRKGNVLFNSGDIEGARRVFLTTGYTDGLVRVGDFYKSQGRDLDALRMYWIAPDKKKCEPILEKLSVLIRTLINEEDQFHE